MNAKWHQQNALPRRASIEQRMAWHREHQQQCGCRPIPARLREQMHGDTPAEAVPSAAESKFSNVVLAFADEPLVTYGGRGFSSRALKLGGQMFALLTTKGDFVVRLSEARARELVGVRLGQYFEPGHGRPMREWLVVPARSTRWLELAREAYTIAQGRRRRAPGTAVSRSGTAVARSARVATPPASRAKKTRARKPRATSR